MTILVFSAAKVRVLALPKCSALQDLTRLRVYSLASQASSLEASPATEEVPSSKKEASLFRLTLRSGYHRWGSSTCTLKHTHSLTFFPLLGLIYSLLLLSTGQLRQCLSHKVLLLWNRDRDLLKKQEKLVILFQDSLFLFSEIPGTLSAPIDRLDLLERGRHVPPWQYVLPDQVGP